MKTEEVDKFLKRVKKDEVEHSEADDNGEMVSYCLDQDLIKASSDGFTLTTRGKERLKMDKSILYSKVAVGVSIVSLIISAAANFGVIGQ